MRLLIGDNTPRFIVFHGAYLVFEGLGLRAAARAWRLIIASGSCHRLEVVAAPRTVGAALCQALALLLSRRDHDNAQNLLDEFCTESSRNSVICVVLHLD